MSFIGRAPGSYSTGNTLLYWHLFWLYKLGNFSLVGSIIISHKININSNYEKNKPCNLPLFSLFQSFIYYTGFLGGASFKEPACRCRRHRRCYFNPLIRKIPWSRKWQPTKSSIPWTEAPGGLQSTGSQRVGHNGSDSTHTNKSRFPRPTKVWREKGN